MTLVPVIDPKTLTRGQRRGRRCAVRNCRRPWPIVAIGVLPSRKPVLVCEDCAPVVQLRMA
jgi:hypothetical protein